MRFLNLGLADAVYALRRNSYGWKGASTLADAPRQEWSSPAGRAAAPIGVRMADRLRGCERRGAAVP